MLSWLDQKRVSALVGTACENLCVPWRSRWKQQQCISRCSHVHCLLPHMGMFSLCLCPCVSRQDILNYFAQLPPWTLATARQYTHHADTRTYSYRDHSSCPSHTWILLDTDQTARNKKLASCYDLVSGNFWSKFQVTDFVNERPKRLKDWKIKFSCWLISEKTTYSPELSWRHYQSIF